MADCRLPRLDQLPAQVPKFAQSSRECSASGRPVAVRHRSLIWCSSYRVPARPSQAPPPRVACRLCHPPDSSLHPPRGCGCVISLGVDRRCGVHRACHRVCDDDVKGPPRLDAADLGSAGDRGSALPVELVPPRRSAWIVTLPHLLPVDPTLHWTNPAGGDSQRDQRPVFDVTPDRPGPGADRHTRAWCWRDWRRERWVSRSLVSACREASLSCGAGSTMASCTHRDRPTRIAREKRDRRLFRACREVSRDEAVPKARIVLHSPASDAVPLCYSIGTSARPADHTFELVDVERFAQHFGRAKLTCWSKSAGVPNAVIRTTGVNGARRRIRVRSVRSRESGRR